MQDCYSTEVQSLKEGKWSKAPHCVNKPKSVTVLLSECTVDTGPQTKGERSKTDGVPDSLRRGMATLIPCMRPRPARSIIEERDGYLDTMYETPPSKVHH